MKSSELLELIAGGENSGVEFKRDDLRAEQLARLFAAGGLNHTELLPVSGSALCDLSRERLTDYLTAIGKRRRPTKSGPSDSAPWDSWSSGRTDRLPARSPD